MLAVVIALAVIPARPASANGSGAGFHGSLATLALAQPIVGMAPTPSGNGYWLVARDGGIFNFGDARFLGSTGNLRLNHPIVGMARSRTGAGYWLVGGDGGIFNFGDARFLGSTGHIHLRHPIVAMASTPSGRGYWLVAADGGIFNFGDAAFYGSTGDRHLPAPVVAIAATPSGRGYWLAGANGSIYNFGDAGAYGSVGSVRLARPVVDVMASPGRGYRMVASDGGIFNFGDAGFFGSAGEAPMRSTIVAAAGHPSGAGYWEVSSNGAVLAFGRETRVMPAGVALNAPAARDSKGAVAGQLFGRLNAERRARGLLPLMWDGHLAALATSWSQEMARSGFRHRDLRQLSAQNNNAYRSVGENIYYGSGYFGDAGSAHTMLMRSAGHRTNIVQNGFSTVGIGVHCDGAGQMWVTETFGAHRAHAEMPWSGPAPAGPHMSTDEGGARC